jgi:hypothetical protein
LALNIGRLLRVDCIGSKRGGKREEGEMEECGDVEELYTLEFKNNDLSHLFTPYRALV